MESSNARYRLLLPYCRYSQVKRVNRTSPTVETTCPLQDGTVDQRSCMSPLARCPGQSVRSPTLVPCKPDDGRGQDADGQPLGKPTLPLARIIVREHVRSTAVAGGQNSMAQLQSDSWGFWRDCEHSQLASRVQRRSKTHYPRSRCSPTSVAARPYCDP